LPFAFVSPRDDADIKPEKLLGQIQIAVRDQIGAIASLGGMIQGKGMIPKTRSGKTLRRVLRELLENAVNGDFDKEVQIPTTIEDQEPVNVAREKVREYFKNNERRHRGTEGKSRL
jgi:propionyl-CoA synthetase